MSLMNKLKKIILITTVVCIVLVAAGLTYAQRSNTSPETAPANYAASREWPTYGHDAGGMRFSPLTQLTPANVARLEVAWVYHMKPPAEGGRGRAGFASSEVTPLVVNGRMYIATPYNRVVAVESSTGK